MKPLPSLLFASTLGALVLLGTRLVPVAAQEQSVGGTVSRVQGGNVEITIDADSGLTVGDEGIVSYTINVGGKVVVNKIARVQVSSVAGTVVRARVLEATAQLQNGYVVTFRISRAAPCVGSVSVETTPRGADVVANNSRAGVTPVLIERLPCGVVTIRASLSGYQDAEIEARIERGSVARAAVSLVRKREEPSTKDKAADVDPTARAFSAPLDRVWAMTAVALKHLGWEIDAVDQRHGVLTTKSRLLEGDDYGVYVKGTLHRLKIGVRSEGENQTTVTVDRFVFKRERVLWVDKDEPLVVTDRTVERQLLDAIARSL